MRSREETHRGSKFSVWKLPQIGNRLEGGTIGDQWHSGEREGKGRRREGGGIEEIEEGSIGDEEGVCMWGGRR